MQFLVSKEFSRQAFEREQIRRNKTRRKLGIIATGINAIIVLFPPFPLVSPPVCLLSLHANFPRLNCDANACNPCWVSLFAQMRFGVHRTNISAWAHSIQARSWFVGCLLSTFPPPPPPSLSPPLLGFAVVLLWTWFEMAALIWRAFFLSSGALFFWRVLRGREYSVESLTV